MTYVGLYLRLPPATLPAQLASLGIGAACIWTVCFVLLPLRPAATLQRAVRSVQRRAGRVLREAGEAADPRPLRRHLVRLNEAALAAEDQLVLLDEPSRVDVRLHLFDLEQAVARLIALVCGGRDAGTALGSAARGGGAAALGAASRRLARPGPRRRSGAGRRCAR